MASLKIRRDDEVIVISGKDRGKTGKVLRVEPKKRKVYVEGLNIVKRHVRPEQSTDPGEGRRRRHLLRRTDPYFKRDARRPEDQEEDARRYRPREGPAHPRRARIRNQARLARPWKPQHTAKVPARLKEHYDSEIRPALIKRFGYSSAMQAPKLQKVTVNMGVGEAKQDSKMLDAAAEQLATITGQKPNIRRARKSIAQFKVREGMPVGLSVTLRGERACTSSSTA